MSATAPPVSPGTPLLLRLPGGRFEHERSLWQHRALLRQLVRTDLQSRYIGTSMGLFWTVIHPLLSILVYIFVFSMIFRARWESLGISFEGNFAVYFCCGMIPWMWFSDSLGGGCQSLVAHGHLLRKNVFPMIVLPLQPILTGMVQFAIAFGIFLVLRVIFFGPPGWVALALPLAVVLQLAFTVGLVQIFAIIHVFWRDMGQLLTSILMLWLWLTPIFYLPIFFAGPIREAFGQWAYDAILWMFWINPFYHIAALYQRLLFFTATPEWQPRVWISIVYLAILSGVLWFVARRLFGRAQARVVEMV